MRRLCIAIVFAGCGRIAFDPTADAAVSNSDGAAALTCTTETFDTAGPEWGFYSDTAGFSTTFTGGELVFTVVANTDGDTGVFSAPHDFTGGRLTFEVPAVVAINNVMLYLDLGVDVDHWYGINNSEGGIVFARRIATITDPTFVDFYNAVDHRWWKLEHVVATNMMEWSTSPDGSSWTVGLTAPADIPLTALTITLGTLEYLGGHPTPGTPRIDNLTYCVR